MFVGGEALLPFFFSLPLGIVVFVVVSTTGDCVVEEEGVVLVRCVFFATVVLRGLCTNRTNILGGWKSSTYLLSIDVCE